MKKVRIIAVGDSTLAKFNDTTYYYPRYGYITKLNEYFNEDVEIINLAMSGRSSKSFTIEDNYETFLNILKKGDYVIIGFGHNDEKMDDPIRFTNANLPLEDPNSFKYSLYNNYIKPALDKGATPILATPIVRLSEEYKDSKIHITPNGDYRLAILELAHKFDLLSVDLTYYSRCYYEEKGFDIASLNHATILGKLENGKIVPNKESIDRTHLNMYGARFMSYKVALDIKDSKLPLKKYLLPNLELPTPQQYLKKNTGYVLKEYKKPDLVNYKAPNHLNITKEGWYGTAFGVCDVAPVNPLSGYFCKNDDKSFILGQSGELHGKMCFSYEGITFVFKQISIEDNFYIKANIKVIDEANTKQAAFGLMLRDDCYLNQELNNETILNHYIAGGLILNESATNVIFSRHTQAEIDRGNNSVNGFYKSGDVITVSLERLGQRISVSLSYNGKLYHKNYYDFDLVAVDQDFMYLGFFATKGTVIKCENIEFKLTSKAIVA